MATGDRDSREVEGDAPEEAPSSISDEEVKIGESLMGNSEILGEKRFAVMQELNSRMTGLEWRNMYCYEYKESPDEMFDQRFDTFLRHYCGFYERNSYARKFKDPNNLEFQQLKLDFKDYILNPNSSNSYEDLMESLHQLLDIDEVNSDFDLELYVRSFNLLMIDAKLHSADDKEAWDYLYNEMQDLNDDYQKGVYSYQDYLDKKMIIYSKAIEMAGLDEEISKEIKEVTDSLQYISLGVTEIEEEEGSTEEGASAAKKSEELEQIEKETEDLKRKGAEGGLNITMEEGILKVEYQGWLSFDVDLTNIEGCFLESPDVSGGKFGPIPLFRLKQKINNFTAFLLLKNFLAPKLDPGDDSIQDVAYSQFDDILTAGNFDVSNDQCVNQLKLLSNTLLTSQNKDQNYLTLSKKVKGLQERLVDDRSKEKFQNWLNSGKRDQMQGIDDLLS